MTYFAESVVMFFAEDEEKRENSLSLRSDGRKQNANIRIIASNVR